MSELERRLRELGTGVEWPPTPDMAAAVRRRLAHAPAPRRPSLLPARPLRRPLAAAIVALLVLAGGAFAASPGFRDAVLDLFGIGGVEIRRVPEAPRPAAPPGADLGLGRHVTLDQARRAVDFPVLVPDVHDEVWVASEPPGGRVSFVTRSPQLLLVEFEGDQVREFIQKSLGPRTTARNVSVNGGPGVWLEGEPHEVVFRDSTGNVQADTVRLAGNVLLWEQDGLTLRLEGMPDLRSALGYAAALRRSRA